MPFRQIRRALLALGTILLLAALFGGLPARINDRSSDRSDRSDRPALERADEEPGQRLQTAAVRPAPNDHLAIPVVGVDRDDLRDHFHEKRGTREHLAIDIAARRDTPVVAVADGRIARLHSSQAGGLTIYLVDSKDELVYYYAHLDRYAAAISEGLKVRRGEVIGHVGTSGNASPNAPHLHFGVDRLDDGADIWRGEPLNPFSLLRDRGITYAPR